MRIIKWLYKTWYGRVTFFIFLAVAGAILGEHFDIEIGSYIETIGAGLLSVFVVIAILITLYFTIKRWLTKK